MALLLATWQKMRLTREKNQLSLKLTRNASRKDRVTKNIERVQKRYEKLNKQFQRQAQYMKQQVTNIFNMQMGLGANQLMPMGMSGMNLGILNIMSAAIKKTDGFNTGQKDSDGNPIIKDFSSLSNVYDISIKNNGKITDENGNPLHGLTKEDVEKYNELVNFARQQQYNNQMMAQQFKSNYDQNVSIWLEAQEEQFEMEQEAALEPLNSEDTMLDLEKTQIEQRLEMITAELQSYTQLASEEAKNAAPKFGLG